MQRMATYKASIKYKYGSGKATTGANASSTGIKGNTESAVMEFLRQKHASVKDLVILIEKIDWK
jgi:hypothetical protein